MIAKSKCQDLVQIFGSKNSPWQEDDLDFKRVSTILIKGTQVFDYKAWVSENNIDTSSIEALEKFSLDELQKVLTVHYRIERFSRNHLLKLANNGYLQKLVERMSELS